VNFGKGKEMKRHYVVILVGAMAAAILLVIPAPCGAAEDKEKQETEEVLPWDEPAGGVRWSELTEERIDRLISRLAETDPQKADELKGLRENDPEKFKAELREVMREQFRQRRRGWAEEDWQGAGREPRRAVRPSPGRRPGPEEGEGRGARRPMIRERHREFLNWYKENYPEEAEKLDQLKEKQPELYQRRLGVCLRRYGRVFEAAEENPELAKVLKEDLEVKQQRDKLLRKIKAAKNEDEKKELTGQLEEVVGSRFDLLVKRKQIEYEQLLKKLERLKKQVEKSEAEVGKWKDSNFKKENVKKRVEELVSGKKEFRWE